MDVYGYYYIIKGTPAYFIFYEMAFIRIVIIAKYAIFIASVILQTVFS